MARGKQNDENANNAVDSTTENENLKQEVAALKDLVQQLLNNHRKTETKAKALADDSEELIEEPQHNASIKIISLVNGGLNLKISNDKTPIYLPDFGSTTNVKYEDLQSIFNNHREAAKEGMFLIQNDKAVKSLYLQRDYEKMIKLKVIENIIELPTHEIVETMKNTTKTIRETITERIVQGIASNDRRYFDRNKINEISKCVGKDLYDLANKMAEE